MAAQTIKYRAKIEKIDGNEILYALPQEVYPLSVGKLEEPRAFDPANLKREFLEVENATYVGSKRRLRKRIAELIPEEVKTIFDPMCGSGAMLKELAQMGKQIHGNDLNSVAYWQCKAYFLAAKPSEEECKAFIDSVSEFDGYFAQNDLWPSVEIPKSYRRWIDGFIKKARNSEHPSFYLGAVAQYLSSFGGSLGGPYDPSRAKFFRMRDLKNDLLADMKEIRSCEGKGKITNLDAFTMSLPSVDLIYYDPPYVESAKYFKRYGKMNSILFQKDWEAPKEPSMEQIAELGKRLIDHCDLLLISSSKDCPIAWKKELDVSRRTLSQKRFKLGGSGLKNRAELAVKERSLSEILWISAKKNLVDIVKAQDPFMIYPPEDVTYKYIMQLHARGRSIHGDLRIEGLQKEYLLGWTLMLQQEGAIKEPVLTMQDLKRIAADSQKYLKINLQTGEWARRTKRGMKPGKTVAASIVATRKAAEPIGWGTFQGVVQPGEVGATLRYPGVFLIVEKGTAQYLSNKTWSHEYFFDGKVFKEGRYFFRQLKAWTKKRAELSDDEEEISDETWNEIVRSNTESIEILKSQGMTESEITEWLRPQLVETMKEMDLSEEDIQRAFVIPPGKEEGLGPELGWLFINPIDQVPYVLSNRAEKENWLPPKDFSALPKHWRSQVKDEEKYWKMTGVKALEARKALHDRFKKEEILKRASEGEVNPFPVKKDIEKARHRRDQCMECSEPPEIEVLWAEGRAHAWFCRKHFWKWFSDPKESGWREVDSAKLVQNGEAAKKFSENRNPNIADRLKQEFPLKKEIDEKALAPEGVESLIPKKLGPTSPIVQFQLTYQFWRGQKVIREGPTRSRYHIWIRTPKKVLDFSVNDSILESDSTGGILYKDRTKSDYETSGSVKPGTRLNPTKATPSFINIQDKGKAILLVDTPSVMKIQFRGSKLKGTFLFKRIEEYWEIKRVRESPAEEKK